MATILVCDDEQVLRTLIRASLDTAVHEIVEAKTGDEALELARRARPDVILLDMMMPGQSGLDVLGSLRADDALAETPVLMLTARTQAADRQQAELAGATHFLAKPFSPTELVAIVDELLASR